MYVWPRVRRFYVGFLERASASGDLSHALSGAYHTCVCVSAWTHVQLAAPASLVNLINPTDISGQQRARAFHDNAHADAPARRHIRPEPRRGWRNYARGLTATYLSAPSQGDSNATLCKLLSRVQLTPRMDRWAQICRRPYQPDCARLLFSGGLSRVECAE